MSEPITMGRGALPPTLSKPEDRLQNGANVSSAAVTPGHRVLPIDRSKVNPEILKAAEGMEAMFLDYMLKVMRQTVPKSEMDLESPATEIYRGMLDSETAQRAARAGGIGLADQIIAYLQPQSYNSTVGVKRPLTDQSKVLSDDRRTGGTDESQSIRK